MNDQGVTSRSGRKARPERSEPRNGAGKPSGKAGASGEGRERERERGSAYMALSVKDLLDAREAYHEHLCRMDNVVATAVGRYLIRRDDLRSGRDRSLQRHDAPARTLENSSVRDNSWPCVLVFVDHWMTREERYKKPEDVVPPFLYLPDGRVVPVCVVHAPEGSAGDGPAAPPEKFPTDLVGGGYPVITEVQGRSHIGSLACLVSDGSQTYALTNRHVTVRPGQEVFTLIGGHRYLIGTGDEKSLGKKKFSDVYLGWPGERVFCNLDAGLVRIRDINQWTAQVYAIGEIGALHDLHPGTIRLDLIDRPVCAHGGTSGKLRGKIYALFYRYKTVGGFDYVADVLIGPSEERDGRTTRKAKEPLQTRRGDSGTLWFFADEVEQGSGPARKLAPVALQWGGQRFDTGVPAPRNYALATFLSTVCRELDLDLVPSWNVGLPETWGAVGHYEIASSACAILARGDVSELGKLFTANRLNITVEETDLEKGAGLKLDRKRFVPLADVPDYVFRMTRKNDDGSHFVDMDERCEAEGCSLMELYSAEKETLHPARWAEWYDARKPEWIAEETARRKRLGTQADDPPRFKRGVLPFRVWQLFDLMVDHAREERIDEFVCAAGIVAHYVGDACQPLHISRLHHGDPDDPSSERVHSTYETAMIDRYVVDLMKGIDEALGDHKVKGAVPANGSEAAHQVVALMRLTFDKLPPADVVRSFGEQEGRNRFAHMWEQLGSATIESMAEGSRVLARIWHGAWVEGRKGLGKIAAGKLGEVSEKDLMALYYDREFLPVLTLEQMAAGGLKGVPPWQHPPRWPF